MTITPQKLARELKAAMDRCDAEAKLPRGSMAAVYKEEVDAGKTDGPVSQWVERQAEIIKGQFAARASVCSPKGLAGLFVGLGRKA